MLLLKRQSQSGHYCDEVNGTHTDFNIIGCAVLFLTGRSNAGKINRNNQYREKLLLAC